MSIKKYSGREPYIFISYSHKDTDIVMPIVERLDKDGYRIWYDEELNAGDSYNEVIAGRIKNCQVMIALLSNNFVKSKYCRKELNYAASKDKTISWVFIEEQDKVTLTDDIDMLMGSIHALDKTSYTEENTFFAKLYGAEDISMCLKIEDNKKMEIKTINYPNGNIYKGETKDGKKEGWGTYFSANGSIFVGCWKNDVRNGYGKINHADGNIYEGEWKNGRKNGKGKLTRTNGDIYDGDFKDDERSGKGKMSYVNGDVYDGYWKKDKKNGQGKMTCHGGDVYECEWKDNEINGKGKIILVNGDIYEGEFKDGMKNGHGKMTLSDGTVIEGEWENGRFKG